MLHSLTRSFSALAMLVGLAVAQVTPIAGTGCPGYTPTVVLGQPVVNGFLTITHAMSCTGGPITYNAVIAIGVVPTTFSFPACVSSTPCVIGVNPFHIVIAPSFAQWQWQIPNIPALSGTCFLAQATCIFQPPPCLVRMHQAVQICIQ